MTGLGSTTVLHQLGHPEKRKRAGQFDTHEVYNSKVDALTHQLDDAMPLYVPPRCALRGHTTIWYEPLEEENVGHGGFHEVTGDVYKHITAPAQRRLSIERAGAKDGAFLATFGRGTMGCARSESRSTFISKLMHEHLATEARQEMWAGQATGSVTCGCGSVLSWAAPDEVSRLQCRHEKGTTVLMTELKADWCRVQKLLGRSRDKAGNLMPGWIVVQR